MQRECNLIRKRVKKVDGADILYTTLSGCQANTVSGWSEALLLEEQNYIHKNDESRRVILLAKEMSRQEFSNAAHN